MNNLSISFSLFILFIFQVFIYFICIYFPFLKHVFIYYCICSWNYELFAHFQHPSLEIQLFVPERSSEVFSSKNILLHGQIISLALSHFPPELNVYFFYFRWCCCFMHCVNYKKIILICSLCQIWWPKDCVLCRWCSPVSFIHLK